MIQINPDKIRVVELAPKEQKTILKHCHSINRDMYNRIKNARNGSRGQVTLNMAVRFGKSAKTPYGGTSP